MEREQQPAAPAAAEPMTDGEGIIEHYRRLANAGQPGPLFGTGDVRVIFAELDALRARAEADRWVPVAERLPYDDNEVHVWLHANRAPAIAYWNGKAWRRGRYPDLTDGQVSHWRAIVGPAEADHSPDAGKMVPPPPRDEEWKVRAEAAEKVIAKLPVTADGVPVTPEMEVYRKDNDGIADVAVELLVLRVGRRDAYLSVLDEMAVDRHAAIMPGKVWSSVDAMRAEAAKKGQVRDGE